MSPDLTASPGHDWVTKLGVKFYRYKNLLKRRWWILFLTIALGLAYESYVIFSKPVTYSSTGSLIVQGKFQSGSTVKWDEETQNFFGTQRMMILSSEIRDRATRRMAIEQPGLDGKVEVTVTIPPRTSIFTVTATGSNQLYTQRYVDVLMEEFLKFKRERMADTADLATQAMVETSNKLKKDIKQREDELHRFMGANDMAFWEEERKNAVRYLSDLKTQQANLVNEQRRLENLTPAQLISSQPTVTKGSETAADPSLGGELTSQYLQKSQQLAQKTAELENMSKVWKPKHPKLGAIQDEIASLNGQLETIKLQMQETTKGRIATIKADLKSLDVSIANWQEKVNEAGRKDAEYQTLQGGVKRAQDSSDKLQSEILSIQQARMTELGSISRNEVATPAREVPKGVIKRFAIGLALGLLVGGFILFILDRADDRFSSSSEIIELFSEPILGQIPNVEASREASGLPLLKSEDERYTFAESFRSLRSSLVFMPNQGDLKLLLVSSAIPGEGKSTVASNLAITMALAGARVLLVDADLRRGDLASLFDIDGRFGLSSVLRGEVKWQSVVQKTNYPTLTLLPRGPVTNQSGELLLVPLVDSLLADFKNSYDLTIFNTSPILATDDTATLAPNFDGTLMVVRAQYTSARLVRNSLNAMYQRQVNILGLILNSVDTEMPDYHYYRYPKYYAA